MTQYSGPIQTDSVAAGGSVIPDKTVASNIREPQVDVQELTDRVYRLFLADLNIQRKRMHGSQR